MKVISILGLIVISMKHKIVIVEQEADKHTTQYLGINSITSMDFDEISGEMLFC